VSKINGKLSRSHEPITRVIRPGKAVTAPRSCIISR